MAKSGLVRKPQFAGMFYDSDSEKLKSHVRNLLAGWNGKKITAKGVLSPHAGYIYSGSTAGAIFSQVKIPGTIVILGPNHTGNGRDIAVYPAGSWVTPMGQVMIDEILSAGIVQNCASAEFDGYAHEMEHSIEVQLPFLQELSPGFSMAAICIRDSGRKSLDELAVAIAKELKGRDAIIIASSDMTHYESAESARVKDERVIALMEKLDAEKMYAAVVENKISMCGILPAYVMLKACAILGANGGRLIKYTNSGETSGDFSNVVGYAGVAII